MALKVVQYIDLNNVNHFARWFDRLEARAAVEVDTGIARVRAGNTSRIKWFSGIGELKIDYGPGYRVYLAQDGAELIILFGGGTKRRQNADVAAAVELYNEYKRRKKRAR